MNSRVFVCCLILLTAFLFPLAVAVHAQQGPSLPAGALADKDGYVIPFQFDSLAEPQIIVQVSINGKTPLPFVLDTGMSAALAVFPEALKTLGLRPGTQHDDVDAFGQKLNVPVTSITSVRLIGVRGKGITFSGQQAEIIDTSTLDAGMMIPQISGIIGLGLLVPNSSGIRLDFEAKTMTVFTKTDLSYGIRGATLLSMSRDNAWSLFSVALSYAPGKLIDLNVDTGSMSTQLPVSAIASLDALAEKSSFSTTVAALYLTPELLLRRFALGAYSAPNVVVSVVSDAPCYSLGINILSRYLVTLDFHNKQMVIQQPAHPILSETLSGLGGYEVDKQHKVIALVDGLPAQAAGVHIGDKLLAINGKPLAGLSDLQAALLARGAAGTRATLLLEQSNGHQSTVSFVRVSEFEQPKTATTGLILRRPTGAPLTILAVNKGCPGDMAGLAKGDQIVALNGKDVAKMPVAQIGDILSANDLSMTIQHLGDKATHTVHLSAATHRDRA